MVDLHNLPKCGQCGTERTSAGNLPVLVLSSGRGGSSPLADGRQCGPNAVPPRPACCAGALSCKPCTRPAARPSSRSPGKDHLAMEFGRKLYEKWKTTWLRQIADARESRLPREIRYRVAGPVTFQIIPGLFQ